MGLLALESFLAPFCWCRLLLGIWRGLVYEVLSMVNWVLAFVLAQWLAHDVAVKLPMDGAQRGFATRPVLRWCSFWRCFAGGLVAALVKKLLTAVGLQPVDRVLGAAFGLVRGVW